MHLRTLAIAVLLNAAAAAAEPAPPPAPPQAAPAAPVYMTLVEEQKGVVRPAGSSSATLAAQREGSQQQAFGESAALAKRIGLYAVRLVLALALAGLVGAAIGLLVGNLRARRQAAAPQG